MWPAPRAPSMSPSPTSTGQRGSGIVMSSKRQKELLCQQAQAHQKQYAAEKTEASRSQLYGPGTETSWCQR